MVLSALGGRALHRKSHVQRYSEFEFLRYCNTSTGGVRNSVPPGRAPRRGVLDEEKSFRCAVLCAASGVVWVVTPPVE
eukprot:1455526-Prymnesium_polylepis.1